jgi:hypothetical protein
VCLILRSTNNINNHLKFEVLENTFKIVLPNMNIQNPKNALTEPEQAVYDLIDYKIN